MTERDEHWITFARALTWPALTLTAAGLLGWGLFEAYLAGALDEGDLWVLIGALIGFRLGEKVINKKVPFEVFFGVLFVLLLLAKLA